MKLKRLVVALLSLTALLAGGCAGDDSSYSAGSSNSDVKSVSKTETTTEKPDDSTTVTVTESPEVTTPKGKLNILTGEYTLSDNAVGKRPVAIMVNNLQKALPQYGVSAADIIYEVPVEGGITRLMAIYGDCTKVPDVCSIRSCRYYFPIFALSYDAVYCHWGKDESIAKDTLLRLNVERLDGYNNSYLFARDAERAKTYDSEHTGYLIGSRVTSAISKAGIRIGLNADKNKPVYNFNATSVAISDKACTSLKIAFSNSYFSDFTYDAKTHTYYKKHNGKNHMDSKANTQLNFKNVFVLETTIKHLNGTSVLMDVNWKGGKGYYISEGTITQIQWSKASEFADIVFTDASGKPLNVNPGKSYIGVTNANTLTYK